MKSLIIAAALVASGVGPKGRIPMNHVVELPRWDKTVYARPGDHLTIVVHPQFHHVEIVGAAYGDGSHQVLHSAVAGRDTVTIVVIVRGQGMISFVSSDAQGVDLLPVCEVRNVWIEIGERRVP